jgi:hypothetical protein
MQKKTFFLVVVTILITQTALFAAEWDRCKVCHRPTGSPGPSKETLLKNFSTVEEFVRAAKTSETPMMAFVRENDELLRAVADEIGIGRFVEIPEGEYDHALDQKEYVYGIDPEEIIENRCTTCHNINRVVYAPKYSAADWLHIVSRMESQSKGLLTPEEMIAVVDWLYAHHEELKPVGTDETNVSDEIPAETRDLLVKNKCVVCHASDRILNEAGVWTSEQWKPIKENNSDSNSKRILQIDKTIH